MTKKRSLFWILGPGVALALVAVLLWPFIRYRYSLSDAAAFVIFSVSDDVQTRYAPGFSESAFEQVKVGMTYDEVRAVLGEPLARMPPHWQDPNTWWRYAQQATPMSHYHQRDILFSPDGRVTNTVRRFYVD